MPKNNSKAYTPGSYSRGKRHSKKSANNFQRAKKPNTCITKLRTETEEIVVFLFGDYAFLSYGISGATGTFRACSVLIPNRK